MDLSFTPEELAFAVEVRAWLAANVEVPPRFENIADEVEFGRRWQARLAERPLGRHPLAGRSTAGAARRRSRSRSSTWSTRGRARCSRSTASASTSPDPRCSRTEPTSRRRAGCRRSSPRTRSGASCSREPERRFRPRVTLDAGAARRRRLVALRAEGVDVVRAVRALGDLPGPHRRRRPEAQGHLVPRRRHDRARDRGASARPDHRRRRVQRGVPRRGVRSRRSARRRVAQRLGGREHDARARARDRVPVQGTGRARGLPRRAVAARGRAAICSTTSRSPTRSRSRSSSSACCGCTTGARCRASSKGIEPGPESSVTKLAWTDMTQALSARALDDRGRGRAAVVGRGRQSRRRVLAAAVAVVEGRLDRGRYERGAAHDHRRTHARPAALSRR